jgi:predicted dehydrogenase
MFNALVIGCGNIGALYDLDTDQIITHAKAYAVNPDFKLTVFDTNKELELKIANTYHADTITAITLEHLNAFDCVSICSPTATHAELLCGAIQAKVPVIICEKPVSNDAEELFILKAKYKEGHSNIIVNYFRRFQPSFAELRNKVLQLLQNEQLTNVAIRYQRGFINNASHAFDLIQFLTDKPFSLNQVQKKTPIYDHFTDDPTLTLTGIWGNASLVVQGLGNIQFSHFEIDLYFESHKILINNAGKTIQIFQAPPKDRFLLPLTQIEMKSECISNYMEPVIKQAGDLLKGVKQKDNFIESVNLNQLMLNYIQN